MPPPPQTLLQPDELSEPCKLIQHLLDELNQMLLGQSQLQRMVLVGILCRGHILLEGLPGVGKTALVKAMGQLLNLKFSRVQFTPDLMPGDILGTHILNEVQTSDDRSSREIVFQPGPVFTNILLADEINRASPKTQSGLLEAMQEGSVTLMGQTRQLPTPFFVLASQNPIELEGTYPLPEAQLDRFLFKLVVSSVGVEVLDQIITTRRRGEPPVPTWSISAQQLQDLFGIMGRIILPRPVARYIARLVAASHQGGPEAPHLVNQYVSYGASPRAAIAISEAARAHALLESRPTAGFEDVAAVAPAVLNHRLILTYKARIDKIDSFAVIEQLLSSLDQAAMNLPSDIQVIPSTS